MKEKRFKIGDTIIIPDVETNKKMLSDFGVVTFGRSKYHAPGDEMKISDIAKYHQLKSGPQYIYFVDGWWYLESDLIKSYRPRFQQKLF